MLIQKPNLTSSLVSFSSAAIDHLWQNGSSSFGVAGVSKGLAVLSNCTQLCNLSLLFE